MAARRSVSPIQMAGPSSLASRRQRGGLRINGSSSAEGDTPAMPLLQTLHGLHCIGLVGMALSSVMALVLGPMGFESDSHAQESFTKSCAPSGLPASELFIEWLSRNNLRSVFHSAEEPELCAAAHAAHFQQIKATLVCAGGLGLLTMQVVPSKADARRWLIFWMLTSTLGCASCWAQTTNQAWLQNQFAFYIGGAQAFVAAVTFALYVHLRYNEKPEPTTSSESGAAHVEPSTIRFFLSRLTLGGFLDSSTVPVDSSTIEDYSDTFVRSEDAAQFEQQFIDGLQIDFQRRQADVRRAIIASSQKPSNAPRLGGPRTMAARSAHDWSAMIDASR